MAGSFKKIDYRLRPAKCVERKMMAEAFRRLSEFGSLDSYQYVGMGSLYFADFSLFHKALGIERMVSIEFTADPLTQQRFQLNSPYKKIEIEFAKSTAALGRLDWNMRSIVWLDYDGALDRTVLDDLVLLSNQLCTGSVLVVSVNAEAPKPASEEAELDDEGSSAPVDLVQALKDKLGADHVPYDLKAADLSGWGVARAYRRIIHSKINDTLSIRNTRISANAKFKFNPIFNFNYSDGARMLTFGGVIVDSGQQHLLSKCGFDQLPYCRSGDDPFLIRIPKLTYREMGELDRAGTPDAASVASIPQGEREKYFETYRFFPNFVQAEMS